MPKASESRISVIMTAYNHSQYIPAAIESILEQDCGDVELIFVDDGSQEDIAARTMLGSELRATRGSRRVRENS